MAFNDETVPPGTHPVFAAMVDQPVLAFVPFVSILLAGRNRMNFHPGKESTKFLSLLLLADLGLMLLHGLFKMHLLSNPLFSVEMDLGYPEIFQYIKEYWIVILLLI